MTLECKNIFFNYSDSGLLIINDFSYTFYSSSVYCINGASGEGKSTLLSILSNTINKKIKSGTITLDNNTDCLKKKNLYDFSLDFYFGEIISFVSQKPIISDDFSFYNLMKIVMRNNNKKIEEIDFILNIFKINSIKNNYFSSFSGGEQYRAAIALSLLKKHMILIMDEPTAHFDDELSKNIIDFIIDHTKKNNSITILASHDNYIKNNSEIEQLYL